MLKPVFSSRSLTAKKRIAIALLVIWFAELSRPGVALALTSGPSQPEVQAFQPAGVSDMVDLQTGDFKYNIPLLDIDGYPLNLNYQSGSGMDDEASWVGLGWTLNPGAINRQVRGVPDDMKGDDATVQHHTKPMITIGGRVTAKTEVFGYGVAASGSVSYGAYINNYTGIGAELAANSGISLSRTDGGMMTGGLGFGISSDSQKGVDVTPYASLSIADNASNSLVSQAGASASLGYNSRSGMKSLTLGGSFGNSAFNTQSIGLGNLGTGITYNTEPLNPKIIVPYFTTSSSFSLDVGVSAGIFIGGGFTGYRTEKKVKNEIVTNPAYGFLYAEKGKNTPNAVMDFVREKENPVIPELSNLPVPIPTPDMFSFSSQLGSGQFRLYRGGTGIFFDAQAKDESTNTSLGGDYGGSSEGVHAGVTYFNQKTSTTTGKWTNDNNYLSYGDFQDPATDNPTSQHAYFKVSGEVNKQDKTLATALGALGVIQPQLAGNTATQNFYGTSVSQPITKQTRETGKTMISYLTSAEAASAALDKSINIYDFNTDGSLPATLPVKPTSIATVSRTSPTARKPHHISEMTVTQSNGKRMIYGLPVYNTRQDEYSFALGTGYITDNTKPSWTDPQLGTTDPLAGTTLPGAGKGIDNYFHRESKAPYATSYLLSAVLSPDYVDRTGDGITDDDEGTAIKFNYAQLPYNYKWRTPYTGASVNRGLLADPDDDKASIVYGEKEIFYVSSIESKTKIAYFITKDRDDGLGVLNWWQGGADATNKQKCLTEIRLYSKADMTRPIKVVKFKYNYSVCPNVYNNPTSSGKLTLERVWFEYGNVDKGKYNPYIFTYNTGPAYAYGQTDRWGTYKLYTDNLDPSLTNEEFPYTSQKNRSTADQNASLWQLTQVDLPTGGEIQVNYEADDYQYVQNRKAMAMYKIVGLVGGSGNADRALIEANGIKLAIPAAYMPSSTIAGSATDRLQWFKTNFLSGSEYLYTKMNVNIGGLWDFISCYVDVTGVEFDLTNNTATVRFDNITDGGVTVNPLIIAAWQKMKNEYPRYAYPGYDNRTKADVAGSISGLVSATINAAGNIAELLRPFYARAMANGLAGKINLDKSFIRLTKYDGPKIGGGSRVKKIYINDEWSAMSGRGDHAFDAYYGQQYDYINEDGTSSGVAAWEPSLGNDENPFRQPVFYTQKIKGAINDYMSLEEPFGESVFPAPGVTYGRVKVSNLKKDKTLDDTYRTGYVVNEFYTSRDFPVKATYTKISPDHYKPNSQFSFVKTVSDDELFMSQGYLVQLNDMNGKPKATRVFNQAGALVSGVEYFYKTADDGSGQLALDNNVKVINKDGSVTDEVLGQDIEMFTDYREQESINKGSAVNVGADIIFALFVPIIIPHFPINQNDDYRLFRSACALKVVQSYGILDHVTKTDNGSVITTQNIAYDGVTGDALVTKTQNEFNNDVYNVNIPAYWGYGGMGPAAKNLGLVLSGLTTSATGFLTNYNYNLDNGDELIDISTGAGAHYWVSSVRLNSSGTPIHDGEDYWSAGYHDQKLIIDVNGNPVKSFSPALVKIVRAGNRNLLEDNISKIVCLSNPITADNKFKLAGNQDLTALKVINASASTFDENWSVEQPESVTKYSTVSPKTGFTFDAVTSILPATTYQGHAYLNAFTPPYENLATAGTNKTDDDQLYNQTEIINNAVRPKFHYDYVDNSGSTLLTNSASHAVLSVYDTFTLPQSSLSYYNIMISGNIAAEFFFDDQICANSPAVKVPTIPSPRNQYDAIFNYVVLAPGVHKMRVDFHDYDVSSSASQSTPIRFLSMALYNGSFAWGALQQPSAIYSLRHLINSQAQMVYEDNQGRKEARFSGPGIDPYGCDMPSTNPYTAGFKGNWRPYQTKVFQQSRAYAGLLTPNTKGVDVKNAGYINAFLPGWYYEPATGSWQQPPAAGRWTVANTVTQVDKYGQQLENVDALQRASAAKFDFNGELPSAVASNSRNRDIYSQTFEDSKFQPGTVIFNPSAYHYLYGDPSAANVPATTDFISGTQSAASLATNTVSHSGNYSLLLPSGGITLNTILNSKNVKDDRYLDVDAKYRFIKSQVLGRYPKGFEPLPGKSYIFDAWIKDGQPASKSVYAYVGVNGSLITLTCKAIVEQWKLVEGTIQVPAGATGDKLTLTITPASGSVYIDDIRIHPTDAQMKTYAYDDKTMRLMAELDENAFATFYEYDDQGLLVRIKKETERGVMTLKETRSAYKKTL